MSGPSRMRSFSAITAGIVVFVALNLPSNAFAQSRLGCEKPNASKMYCRNGKRREVCQSDKQLVWRDTRMLITRGDFIELTVDGGIPSPHCGCIDAEITCVKGGSLECDAVGPECNRALNSGGRFCVANQWGGNTCY